MNVKALAPRYRAQLFSQLLTQTPDREGWDKVFQLLHQGQQAARAAQLPEIAEQIAEGRNVVIKGLGDTGKFLDWELSMLAVGLTTANIGNSFQQLRDHYQLQENFATELKSQLRGPVLIVMSALAVMYGWLSIGQHLSVYSAVSSWLLAIIILVAIVTVMFRLARSVSAGTEPLFLQRWLRPTPVIGSVIRSAQLVHFFNNLNQSVAAKLPLAQSLTISAGTIPDRYYRRKCMQVQQSIVGGLKLSAALSASGLLKGVIIGPISIRNAGAGDAMAHLAAAVYRHHLDQLQALIKGMPQLVFVLLPVLGLIQVLML